MKIVPENIKKEVLTLIKKGEAQRAIDLLVNKLDMNRKEAKEYTIGLVDPDLETTHIDNELRDKVIEAISDHGKLSAVKILKEATGLDLKDCKEYVDALEASPSRISDDPPPDIR